MKMFYLNPIDYLEDLWGNWESINQETSIYFLSFEHSSTFGGGGKYLIQKSEFLFSIYTFDPLMKN